VAVAFNMTCWLALQVFEFPAHCKGFMSMICSVLGVTTAQIHVLRAKPMLMSKLAPTSQLFSLIRTARRRPWNRLRRQTCHLNTTGPLLVKDSAPPSAIRPYCF
jgi:hypothetical protein